MKVELRPLSLGEVLDRTFQIFRARFGMFVGIATIAAAVETGGSALQMTTTRILLYHTHNRQFATAWNGLSSLISLCITLLAVAVVFAAMTRAVAALYLGQPTGIYRAYREVWGRWFRYVRLSFSVAFLSGWPFLLVLGTLFTEIALASRHKAAHSAALAATVFGITGVEILIAVPICIWLLLRYALSNAACVVEGLNVRRSLKRAVKLSKDLRARIFVLLAVTYLVRVVISVMLLSPTFSIMAHSRGHVPLGVTIYTLLIGFVMSSLTTPIYGIGLTLMYFDARIRKEGFDIEVMMQRFGSQPEQPIAPWIAGESTGVTLG